MIGQNHGLTSTLVREPCIREGVVYLCSLDRARSLPRHSLFAIDKFGGIP